MIMCCKWNGNDRQKHHFLLLSCWYSTRKHLSISTCLSGGKKEFVPPFDWIRMKVVSAALCQSLSATVDVADRSTSHTVLISPDRSEKKWLVCSYESTWWMFSRGHACEPTFSAFEQLSCKSFHPQDVMQGRSMTLTISKHQEFAI